MGPWHWPTEIRRLIWITGNFGHCQSLLQSSLATYLSSTHRHTPTASQASRLNSLVMGRLGVLMLPVLGSWGCCMAEKAEVHGSTCTYACMAHMMDGRTDGRTGRRTDGRRTTYGWMGGWMVGRMGRPHGVHSVTCLCTTQCCQIQVSTRVPFCFLCFGQQGTRRWQEQLY